MNENNGRLQIKSKKGEWKNLRYDQIIPEAEKHINTNGEIYNNYNELSKYVHFSGKLLQFRFLGLGDSLVQTIAEEEYAKMDELDEVIMFGVQIAIASKIYEICNAEKIILPKATARVMQRAIEYRGQQR